MVKVNAPLMSLDASGTVADSITFSKWKGRAYVRSRVIPANPKTGKQTGMRSMIAFLSQQWQSLADTDKSSWVTIAKQKNVSPFNQYTGTNAFNWRNGLYPSKAYPADRNSTAPATPTIVATGSQRQVTLQITAGTPAPTWGYSIHRAQTSSITPNWTNCVAVIPKNVTDPTVWIDTPLDAGTYYYKAVPFNQDGKTGTASSEQTATVT